jgi:molybdopterin converting factor small subunit
MIKVWMHSMFVKDSALQESDFSFRSDSPTKLFDVLESVCGEDEALFFKFIDEQENLRPHVAVFIGSTNCRNLKGINSFVSPNDEISVFPALSGG